MEKLVSPSKWSQRENVCEEHVRIVTSESQRVLATVKDRTTRYYGEKSTNKLEIYGLKNKGRPIFVYISGGYWQELSGDISHYPIQPMVDEGVVGIVVDYTRAPKVNMFEIVDEVIEASKSILDFALETGSKSIILSGHSAGSQLCSMIITSEWFSNLSEEHRSYFKAVFHLSGLFDLKVLLGTYVNDALKMDTEAASLLSPLSPSNLKKLEDVTLPISYIIVSENDSPLFIEQAQTLASEMVKFSKTNELHFQVIKDLDHFNLVENLRLKDYEITKNILYLINKLE